MSSSGPRRFHRWGLVVAFCALAACHGGSGRRLASPDGWRADLQYLATELPSRHVRAFHAISRDRFATAVSQLDAAIPALNDDQMLVALMRLVSLIGDGQTHLDLPPTWPRYPIEFAWFGNELHVVSATTPQAGVLGARVARVGGMSLDSAMNWLSRFVPQGENDARTRLVATTLLAVPRVLHGLDLAPTESAATFDFVASNGGTITETLKAIPPRDVTDWRVAAEATPLWLRRPGEPWWVEVLPDSRTVYFSFSGYPLQAEFDRRAQELARVIDESGAHRLVIDLRHNEGGDLALFRRLLIPLLQARRAINHAGGVYALIGPGTFSTATVNAQDLRLQLRATLVGESTGGRPAAYGTSATFVLPNSGLRVSYSTEYYRSGPDTAKAVEPDRQVASTWADFRAGHDAALDWILAQPVD